MGVNSGFGSGFGSGFAPVSSVLDSWFFLTSGSSIFLTSFDSALGFELEVSFLSAFDSWFDWNDVGSWQVVYELGEKDNNQNVIVKNIDSQGNPPIETYNTTGSLIYYTDHPIAVVGLKDVVVVDTGSGILICDRKQSNDVKKIVDQLKAKQLEEYI